MKAIVEEARRTRERTAFMVALLLCFGWRWEEVERESDCVRQPVT